MSLLLPGPWPNVTSEPSSAVGWVVGAGVSELTMQCEVPDRSKTHLAIITWQGAQTTADDPSSPGVPLNGQYYSRHATVHNQNDQEIGTSGGLVQWRIDRSGEVLHPDVPGFPSYKVGLSIGQTAELTPGTHEITLKWHDLWNLFPDTVQDFAAAIAFPISVSPASYDLSSDHFPFDTRWYGRRDGGIYEFGPQDNNINSPDMGEPFMGYEPFLHTGDPPPAGTPLDPQVPTGSPDLKHVEALVYGNTYTGHSLPVVNSTSVEGDVRSIVLIAETVTNAWRCEAHVALKPTAGDPELSRFYDTTDNNHWIGIFGKYRRNEPVFTVEQPHLRFRQRDDLVRTGRIPRNHPTSRQRSGRRGTRVYY